MLKKLLFIIIVFIALALGAMFYVQKGVDAFLGQSLRIESPQLVTIKRGNSLNTVFSQFQKNDWIDESPFSQLVRRFHPELSQLKVGTFQLQPGMDLTQAIDVLNEGIEYQLAITFIEGSTFKEWREQLSAAEHLNQVASDMSEADIAAQLEIPQTKLEGLFLAETYHYAVGDSDLDILRRAHNKLDRILTTNWNNKQQGLPLKTPYEALILASIIEKETAVASERERVASVFVNRLNRPMRLQTDPTVIYGMGERYDGNIRKKDLRERTPYNTYVIDGLPPTPIAMPGEASIHAALHPEKSRYLYFVASGTGGHVFSKNLRDHNRAVQKYLKTIRSQK
ncbi:endolytic transglycosylase MltG [Vibrio sp. ZSDZ65]|uniref:Endolytic murein transglycosylase n=1 Tax=Vibrio qingdaonensis TaxID=2829491 RepID=A0A9X3CKE9_9VIBR|nr:endolytic transglycosylase MltG [Vibrio qingdaonensis]MCW8344911.1 endolytic transglycosylase MltG [Vibrio qingdaonensis]